ncbi:MAG: PilT/PilU family type 4a pilus ATPase [Patescibacteria group bacterium]
MVAQIAFNLILEAALKESASDIHITVGRNPTIRMDGVLIPLLKFPIVDANFSKEFADILLSSEEARARFIETKEQDFSYRYQDRARFRVNVFQQRGLVATAMRYIPNHIRDFAELNLPVDLFKEVLSRSQGFVLVVGPIGQGKSTTLAAMIQHLNQTTTSNILTIEDPIEFLFTSDRSIINQREVPNDTLSFGRALKSMFREDVNVVMIGEMRDPETIATALTAAETGHLILSSLHTNNASQTIDRIIDSFSATQQNQVRAQLSETLVAIVSQRLLPKIRGGRVPALEIMLVNTAIRNLIREKKTYEIDLIIETHSRDGMMSLNRSLASLVRRGEISLDSALNFSTNPGELKMLTK